MFTPCLARRSLPVLVALTSALTAVPASALETSFQGEVWADGTSWRTHAIALAAGDLVTGTLTWTTPEADLNLNLLDPSRVVVAWSKTARPEVVEYRATSTGEWRFGVKAVTGNSPYRLTVEIVPGGSEPPPEPGAWALVNIAGATGVAATAETWTADPVDANGDGLEDVWIGYHDNGGKLWRANGDGSMSWVAQTAWPMRRRDASGDLRRIDRHGCAWADVDGNGLVDAYCTVGRTGFNWVKGGVIDNELWLQTSPGDYAEVGTEVGIGDPYGRSRAAVLFDATGDGRPDLYVTNELPRAGDADGDLYGQNKLFLNVTAPTSPLGFRFVAAPGWGVDRHLGSGRAVIAFDQNADGRNDLLVTGKARPYLFRNVGGGFVDASAQVGLPTHHVEDVALADLDADGTMDLVEVDGGGLKQQRNLGTTFEHQETIRSLSDGWAVAVGDADGDGTIDVYVQRSASASNPPDYLMLNRPGSWVALTAPAMGGRGSDVEPLALRGTGRPVDFLVLNGNLNVAGPVMVLRLVTSNA